MPTATPKWTRVLWSTSILLIPFSWFWAACLSAPVLIAIPKTRLRQDPVSAALLLTLGLICLSQTLFNGALIGNLTVLELAPPILFFLVLRPVMTDEHWRSLTTTLLLLTLVPLGVMGLGQMLWHWEFLFRLQPPLPGPIGHRLLLGDQGWPPGRMNSTLDHANSLAFYLTLAWPLLLDRLLQLPSEWKWKRWGLTLLGMLSLTCLAETGSRNGLVMMVITTGLIVVARRRQLRPVDGTSLGLFFLTGLVAYGLPLLITEPSNTDSLFNRFGYEFSEETAPGHNRLHVWGTALQMIIERPWFGHGPLAFDQRFHARYEVWLGHPHNIILMLAIGQGIPAMLALLGTMIWSLLRSLQERFGHLNQALRDPYVVSVVGLLGLSMVDLPFFKWQTSFLAMLILATAARPSSPTESPAPQACIPPGIVRLLH